MYVGRPLGGAWLGPVGPTPADEVEFNRDHPLAPNVVAFWAARGGVLQDMLGTVGDMIVANSGVAENTLGGPSFGNLGSTARACYAPSDPAWKPTAATTIMGLFAAPPGGASGWDLFGTAVSVEGWGCYAATSGTPRMYMRINNAWTDVSATGTITREPVLVGMTYSGSSFTARWDGSKNVAAASGPITQGAYDLDIANHGGGFNPNGNTAALCLHFTLFDRALSDDEWEDMRRSPWQLLRTVRRPILRTAAAAPITGTLAATLAAATLAATGIAIPHGVARRRGRVRAWQDVPAELAPVVGLAETYADAAPVQRAVDDALARYAALGMRASAARRAALLERLSAAVVAAVERAAEDDDEEALTALL